MTNRRQLAIITLQLSGMIFLGTSLGITLTILQPLRNPLRTAIVLTGVGVGMLAVGFLLELEATWVRRRQTGRDRPGRGTP